MRGQLCVSNIDTQVRTIKYLTLHLWTHYWAIRWAPVPVSQDTSSSTDRLQPCVVGAACSQATVHARVSRMNGLSQLTSHKVHILTVKLCIIIGAGDGHCLCDTLHSPVMMHFAKQTIPHLGIKHLTCPFFDVIRDFIRDDLLILQFTDHQLILHITLLFKVRKSPVIAGEFPTHFGL